MDRQGKGDQGKRLAQVSPDVVEQEITRLLQRRARRGKIMLWVMGALIFVILCMMAAMYIWPGQVHAGQVRQWPGMRIEEVGSDGNGQ